MIQYTVLSRVQAKEGMEYQAALLVDEYNRRFLGWDLIIFSEDEHEMECDEMSKKK